MSAFIFYIFFPMSCVMPLAWRNRCNSLSLGRNECHQWSRENLLAMDAIERCARTNCDDWKICDAEHILAFKRAIETEKKCAVCISRQVKSKTDANSLPGMTVVELACEQRHKMSREAISPKIMFAIFSASTQLEAEFSGGEKRQCTYQKGI